MAARTALPDPGLRPAVDLDSIEMQEADEIPIEEEKTSSKDGKSTQTYPKDTTVECSGLPAVEIIGLGQISTSIGLALPTANNKSSRPSIMISADQAEHLNADLLNHRIVIVNNQCVIDGPPLPSDPARSNQSLDNAPNHIPVVRPETEKEQQTIQSES